MIHFTAYLTQNALEILKIEKPVFVKLMNFQVANNGYAFAVFQNKNAIPASYTQATFIKDALFYVAGTSATNTSAMGLMLKAGWYLVLTNTNAAAQQVTANLMD